MAEIIKKRRLSAEGSYEASQKVELDQYGIQETSGDTKKEQRRSLFVRSLPPSYTTEQLAEHFSQSYPIKHATVVQDPTTKVSKGYGFVTFADPEDAQQALAEFNGSKVEGRKIKVEVAQPRHRELAGDGGKSVPTAETVKQKAQRQQQKQEAQPPKLIIRNLPWSIKEPEDLVNLFRSYGKVKSAVIPKKGPKTQAGFGFVVLRGRKNAEKALEGVNGKEVDGRTLAVDWAVDKDTWEKLQETETQDNVALSEIPEGGQTRPEAQGEVEDSEASGAEDPLLDHEMEDDTEDEVSDEMIDNDAELSELEDEIADKAEEEEHDDKENSNTIFIRNLPYSADDDALYERFTTFGPVRYARVVYDPETERPRGTGFVCFYNEENAKECVRNAPKPTPPQISSDKKVEKAHSVLQNEGSDPSGRYTMDGRVLQITRALNKAAATRKEAEGSDKRDIRDRDKRRLYLLSEGTIDSTSALYNKLSPTEISMRAASLKQRQNIIKSNPSLHLSLTRLSIRNIPRSVTSKDLKQLAREAVVGFAKDAKEGLRAPLAREELARGGEEMREAERFRKTKGKGVVKQAKIVFESREGSKINEHSGAGRSRGYGFIEYYTHRSALMGLRWLNGHAVKSTSVEKDEQRQKRLIVEFAIENAQVVTRRRDIEEKARNGEVKQGRFAPKPSTSRDPRGKKESSNRRSYDDRTKPRDNKRKRSASDAVSASSSAATTTKKTKKAIGDKQNGPSNDAAATGDNDDKNKVAKRNRIIAKKRQMRKARSGRK